MHHGHQLVDSYHWLRDPDYPSVESPEILNHLAAENDYFEAAMAPHAVLTETLYSEIVGRVKQDAAMVPYPDGDYHYWWKFKEGAQYRDWFRRLGGFPTPEQQQAEAALVLDESTLAAQHSYFRVGGMAISPDHRLLAWGSDTNGSEQFDLRIKEVDSGRLLEDRVESVAGPVTWTADSSAFLYTLLSSEHRPYKVMLHSLGTPTAHDIVVYEEDDPAYFVRVSSTSSRRFIRITVADHVTSEVRLLPANEPTAPAIVLAKRQLGHKYFVDDHEDTLYIRSNDKHTNFRIITAPVETPGRDHWQELIAGSDQHYLTGLRTFADFFVLEERVSGQEQIRISNYQGEYHHVAFPEPSFTVSLGPNLKYRTESLRLFYQSLVTPSSDLLYQVPSRSMQLLKEEEIASGYDKNKYVSERLMAVSHDGCRVPVSIVYRKDLGRNQTHPTHLYGYGAYGVSIPPRFSASRLSLLDRGFVFAIAHTRGGDEMGHQWYADGKLGKRSNTFHDFIACAELLCAEGFAAKGQISISGASAGGTLMGAVSNLRPELWRAVIAEVPFVDVLNTMLDSSLPLTPIEWPEWGNPAADEQAFRNILSYSPYENVSAQDYPMMMVTAGRNDPHVTYWEPAKWVAKLRELKTDDNLLICRTEMGGGHSGKSGRFESYMEEAERYTFLLKAFCPPVS